MLRGHALLQVRQLRFQEVIESAQAAAQKHDSHSLFQIINRYSPKQPRRRMQLRNIHGQIASPMEETAMPKQFIAETWHGPSHFPAPEEPLTCMPLHLDRADTGSDRDTCHQGGCTTLRALALCGNPWQHRLHLPCIPPCVNGGKVIPHTYPGGLKIAGFYLSQNQIILQCTRKHCALWRSKNR